MVVSNISEHPRDPRVRAGRAERGRLARGRAALLARHQRARRGQLPLRGDLLERGRLVRGRAPRVRALPPRHAQGHRAQVRALQEQEWNDVQLVSFFFLLSIVTGLASIPVARNVGERRTLGSVFDWSGLVTRRFTLL